MGRIGAGRPLFDQFFGCCKEKNQKTRQQHCQNGRLGSLNQCQGNGSTEKVVRKVSGAHIGALQQLDVPVEYRFTGSERPAIASSNPSLSRMELEVGKSRTSQEKPSPSGKMMRSETP